MKNFKKLYVVFFVIIIFSGCVSNPITGKSTMALIPNSTLFPMAFSEYSSFINENTVVRNTAEAQMITRVGNRIVDAAQKWLAAEGQPHYFKDYQWEFNLIQDNSINAWVMPGGKVVFYTGILPVCMNEAGVAVVMGHEIAHAILNHGQQRMSAGLLQQVGLIGVSVAVGNQSPLVQASVMAAFGIGSNLAVALPFSRQHEYEADEYGLILMAIAGYNPDEGAGFWQRMSSLGGGSVPEFLSTHPSDANRVRNLQEISPRAKQKAAEFGVTF